MKDILCLVYFAEDVEDGFGYGELNVIQVPHVWLLIQAY